MNIYLRPEKKFRLAWVSQGGKKNPPRGEVRPPVIRSTQHASSNPLLGPKASPSRGPRLVGPKPPQGRGPRICSNLMLGTFAPLMNESLRFLPASSKATSMAASASPHEVNACKSKWASRRCPSVPGILGNIALWASDHKIYISK